MDAAVSERTHRVRYAALAVFTEFALGVSYTWSVFRGPLGKLHGWSEAQTIAPYRYSILTFAIAIIFAGIWVDRRGPRIVGIVGEILLSLGCVFAGIFSGSVTGLVLFLWVPMWIWRRILLRAADRHVYQVVP
jgi:hypothetical protein